MGLRVQAVSSWRNLIDNPRSMNDVVQCLWAHVSWGFVGILCSPRMCWFSSSGLGCLQAFFLPSCLPVLDLVLWLFSLRMQRSNLIYRIGMLDLADTTKIARFGTWTNNPASEHFQSESKFASLLWHAMTVWGSVFCGSVVPRLFPRPSASAKPVQGHLSW